MACNQRRKSINMPVPAKGNTGLVFARVRSALASMAISTSLTIRWGKYEVRVGGLNNSHPAQWDYAIKAGLKPLPKGVFVLGNARNQACIDIGNRGPCVSPRPVQGYQTRWIGGVQAPWLLRPLSVRVSQAIGVWIDPDSWVWASEWVVRGRRAGFPVRVLANPDNTSVTLPPSAELEAGGPTADGSLWRVPRADVDPRIPVWTCGHFGPLFLAGDPAAFPAPAVGVRLPWGFAAVVCAHPGTTLVWDQAVGPAFLATVDDLPDGEEWLIAIHI